MARCSTADVRIRVCKSGNGLGGADNKLPSPRLRAPPAFRGGFQQPLNADQSVARETRFAERRVYKKTISLFEKPTVKAAILVLRQRKHLEKQRSSRMELLLGATPTWSRTLPRETRRRPAANHTPTRRGIIECLARASSNSGCTRRPLSLEEGESLYCESSTPPARKHPGPAEKLGFCGVNTPPPFRITTRPAAIAFPNASVGSPGRKAGTSRTALGERLSVPITPRFTKYVVRLNSLPAARSDQSTSRRTGCACRDAARAGRALCRRPQIRDGHLRSQNLTPNKEADIVISGGGRRRPLRCLFGKAKTGFY